MVKGEWLLVLRWFGNLIFSHRLRCEKPVSRELVKRIFFVVTADFYFSRSVVLGAPPDVVCRWHENPQNLREISPPWLRIHEVRAAPVAEVGGEFFLHVSQLGFPLRWHGRWIEVRRPQLLVDDALASPFSEWRHEHHFVAEGAGTRMTDVVRCRLGAPWGRLPGARLGLWVLFSLMFWGRHRATREFFRRHPGADPGGDIPAPGG
jgi:ligand-binding SRPBCC domain-containing protein